MSLKHRTYVAYKVSGIDWVGLIPEQWTTIQLDRVARVKARLGWKALKADEYVEEGFPFLATPDIKRRDIDFSNTNFINEYRFRESPEIILCLDDVLLAKDGSTLGIVNVVRSLPKPSTVNSSIAVIRPFQNQLYGVYLQYLIKSAHIQSTIELLKDGMGVPHLFQSDIRKLTLLLPPLPEQQAIAAFLDRETARIDALIARKERLLELLEEKRKAIISQAVTRGLDANVPMKDSGVEWLGQVPEGWAILPLKRVGAVRYGLGQPPAEQESGTPLIRATNVDAGKITEKGMMYVDITDVPTSRNAVLSVGEIIVVRSGAYTGDSAIIPPKYAGSIAGYDMVLTINKGIDVFYGWQLLSQHVEGFQFELQKMRAAQPHLNAEELMETIVVVPPESEQQAIAAYLDAQTVKLDVLRQKMKQSVEKLSEYRTSLISAAVTGKIDVRGKVPD